MTMTRAKVDDVARPEWLGIGGGLYETLMAPLTATVAHPAALS